MKQLLLCVLVFFSTFVYAEETTRDKVVAVAEEPLKVALMEIVNSAIAAKDFLLAEIPDVIYQLLLWNFWYYLVICIAPTLVWASINSIFFIFIVPYLVEKDIGDAWIPICIFGLGADAVLTGWMVYGWNLQWLQIWIAPKIWLIEYAANLVK